MARRAQGISVNVIIIAAIALVVMVLLITLVLNTGRDTDRAINSCSNWDEGIINEDWACIPEAEPCSSVGLDPAMTRSCSDDEQARGTGPKCCINIV